MLFLTIVDADKLPVSKTGELWGEFCYNTNNKRNKSPHESTPSGLRGAESLSSYGMLLALEILAVCATKKAADGQPEVRAVSGARRQQGSRRTVPLREENDSQTLRCG
jgi:hypothetical protein